MDDAGKTFVIPAFETKAFPEILVVTADGVYLCGDLMERQGQNGSMKSNAIKEIYLAGEFHTVLDVRILFLCFSFNTIEKIRAATDKRIVGKLPNLSAGGGALTTRGLTDSE